jgi:hypothetical protein
MIRHSKIIIAAFAFASLALSGCYVVHNGSISSAAAKGTKVSSSASDWGILHLTAPQGLTSTVDSQLLGQCPTGKVSNISTELASREFILAQMYTVSADGYCQ